jgi:hypothetical protein
MTLANAVITPDRTKAQLRNTVRIRLNVRIGRGGNEHHHGRHDYRGPDPNSPRGVGPAVHVIQECAAGPCGVRFPLRKVAGRTVAKNQSDSLRYTGNDR